MAVVRVLVHHVSVQGSDGFFEGHDVERLLGVVAPVRERFEVA